MRTEKLILLFALVIVHASVSQAANTIKLVRDRSANGEAIKLDMQAQEQMQKGDLAGAARTIDLAMQKDPTVANLLHARQASRTPATIRVGHPGL
jgi:Tfp pilus assembly protein PilF